MPPPLCDTVAEMSIRPPRQPSFLPASRGLTFQSHEEWKGWLHALLPRPSLPPDSPFGFDLFAGCGGLGLGFECAGFKTHGYEMKAPAARSYAENLDGGCDHVMLDLGMPDGREGGVDLIIGGPPCQPFSQIGYQRGHRDPRDGFPVFLDAVARLRPKIAIIENVRGLLFRNRDYLAKAADELKRFGYQVDARLLNARDYGAPQNRERVVVVAHLGGWEWPEAVVTEPVAAGIAIGDTARGGGPGLPRFALPPGRPGRLGGRRRGADRQVRTVRHPAPLIAEPEPFRGWSACRG